MYIQIKQAADLLNMSRQWLYILIQRGDITTKSIAGRDVVIDDAKFRAEKRRGAKRPRRAR